MQLRLPDGRSLDVFLDGPETGTPFVYHFGTPAAGGPTFAPIVDALAERGLRLTLAVDSIERIVDELLTVD